MIVFPYFVMSFIINEGMYLVFLCKALYRVAFVLIIPFEPKSLVTPIYKVPFLGLSGQDIDLRLLYEPYVTQ